MSDETKPKQPWTPGPISEEYIRAAFRHVTKQTDLDGLGLEHLKDAISDGSINIPTCYGGDPKLYAAAPALAEALAELVTAFEGTQQAPDDGSSVRWVRLIRAAEKARAALDLCGWRWS
jgi:hypothetical protein